MQALTAILFAASALPAAFAITAPSLEVQQAAALVDFYNPITGGGSWLDNAGGGLGEPLNVGISSFFDDLHTKPSVL